VEQKEGKIEEKIEKTTAIAASPPKKQMRNCTHSATL